MKMPTILEGWWAQVPKPHVNYARVLFGCTPEHFAICAGDQTPLDKGYTAPLCEVWGKLPKAEQQLIVQGRLIVPDGGESKAGPILAWSDGAFGAEHDALPVLTAALAGDDNNCLRKDSPWYAQWFAYQTDRLEVQDEDA